MNMIFISGRFGRDPELKTAQNGTEYVNFAVAVDRRPEQDGSRKTDWFYCSAFGKTAAFVATYFKKGDGVEIRGRMEDDVYTAKNDPDKKIHSWSLMVEQIEFPKGSKKDAPQTAPAPVPAQTYQTAPAPAQKQETMTFPIEDDDIPF